MEGLIQPSIVVERDGRIICIIGYLVSQIIFSLGKLFE